MCGRGHENPALRNTLPKPASPTTPFHPMSSRDGASPAIVSAFGCVLIVEIARAWASSICAAARRRRDLASHHGHQPGHPDLPLLT